MTRKWSDFRPGQRTKQADLNLTTALRNLADNGDFRIMFHHFSELVETETVDRSAPNVSALLIIEGRRTLLRDIERALEQANSAGPDRDQPAE